MLVNQLHSRNVTELQLNCNCHFASVQAEFESRLAKLGPRGSLPDLVAVPILLFTIHLHFKFSYSIKQTKFCASAQAEFGSRLAKLGPRGSLPELVAALSALVPAPTPAPALTPPLAAHLLIVAAKVGLLCVDGWVGGWGRGVGGWVEVC